MKLRPTIRIGSSAEIDGFLKGLVEANVVQRRAGIVPSLYDAKHVRYMREPRGKEDWQTAVQVFHSGVGDCEDLSSWLAADFNVMGLPNIRGDAVTRAVVPGLRHAVTRVQVGPGAGTPAFRGKTVFFDPSKWRGM